MKRKQRQLIDYGTAIGGGRTLHPGGSRTAFTLVELLVSAGLVVLMLLMFATIFQLATGSMGTQRGIAENDQRARTLTTVIRNDIANRTFRSVVAFAPGETPPPNPEAEYDARSFALRRGYLYISENDPDDDRDDVLAFTALVPLNEAPFFGRAGWTFFNDTNNNGVLDSGLPSVDDDGDGQTDETIDEPIYPNQPEFDGDGDFSNRMASSHLAEICYFLRAGSLCRRVMLVRPRSGSETQPRTNLSSEELFDPDPDNDPSTNDSPYVQLVASQGLAPVFYRDFDFSAFAIDADDANGNPIVRLQFHGFDSLDNRTARFLSLGIPRWRFGHNHATHLPREFIGSLNNPAGFMGRFTHEETSHNAFTYPFRLPNPYGATLNDTSPADGVVDALAGGPRRAEDVLMTNVHGFDVKVWDDRAGGWRDIGWRDSPNANPPVIGDYSESQNGHRSSDPNNVPHIAYGPHDVGVASYIDRNRVFDTWHPSLQFDLDTGRLDAGQANNPQPAPPPYRPFRFAPGADGAPGVLGVDDDGANGIDDPGELGASGSDDFPFANPMRAMQLTIRYYDVSSDQNRQLTLDFSLLD